MEPAIGDTVGVGTIQSSGSVDRDDTIRIEPRRAINDQWGVKQYNGFTTCPVTSENIAYAVQLAQELHGLGTLRSVPFNWHHCMRTMRMVSSNPMFIVRLANNGIDYCGAVVGHVDTFFFSPRLLASENAWFVREGTPFRAKIAMTLMREFVEWAMRDKGADHVQCGDIANINTMAVDALYRRLGFKRYGVLYQYGGV